MKTSTLIAIIAAALVIAGLVLWFLLSRPVATAPAASTGTNPFDNSTPSAQAIYNDTPSRTAQSCFGWYVSASGNGADYTAIAQLPEAGRCFTEEFIQQWDDTVASTGSDPVLFSQYIDPAWLSSIRVSDGTSSGNSGVEEVHMGSGSNQTALTASLVKISDGTWRISDVNLATGGRS